MVTEVYKFSQEIGAATNEQSHGSSQIAKATSRLTEITHEINSAVEEQASGAQAVVMAMERCANWCSAPRPVPRNWPLGGADVKMSRSAARQHGPLRYDSNGTVLRRRDGHAMGQAGRIGHGGVQVMATATETAMATGSTHAAAAYALQES